jgi:hypothetical protein
MSLAPLVAQLTAIETAFFAAYDTVTATLAPINTELRAVIEYPPDCVRKILDLAEREDYHLARLRTDLREASLKKLVEQAGELYGAPGVPVVIELHEVHDAVLGEDRCERDEAPLLDLAAAAAFLERTYGGNAGAAVAAAQLRQALRRSIASRVSAPAPKGQGGIALYAYAPVDKFAGGRRYTNYDTLFKALTQLGDALSLLGESVNQGRIQTEATRVFRYGHTISSRARYDVGCGIAFVTMAEKVIVEMPANVARRLTDWLAIDDPASDAA